MTQVVHVQTEATAREALAAGTLHGATMAFDTETTGLQVRSGHHDIGRTVQVSWRPWAISYVFEMTERWREHIEAIFEQADELIAHNLKFDAHVMHTFGINVMEDFPHENLHDTVWVARLHDERDPARLKPLSAKYLRADAADEQSKLKRLMNREGWGWDTVPVKYLIEYGGLDAIYTGQLFDLLHPRISFAADAYAREQRLCTVLYKAERAGLLVDQELLNKVLVEERDAVEHYKAEVQRLAPGLNPNSPIQLKAIFRDRGHEIDDTQAATLKALDDELAVALLTFRDHAKTYGTYVEPWSHLITPEGRIHPSFNSMGTVTGRFSSDSPNFQNISKSGRGAGGQLRNVFVAAPGHQIVVADWNQMELRMYAHFANDENMRAAFLSGDDIYLQASDLLGVPRDIGKMIMLASIYGAGPKTLKAQCINMAWKYGQAQHVPLLQGYDWQALYERFHRAYGIKSLARLTELAARRRGMLGEPYILTIGGRRQRPKLIKQYPVNGHRHTITVYKDLGNSLVQGSSADLMKESLIAIDDAGYGDMLRLTVHDEAVLEVPNEKVEEVSEALVRIMTRNEFVPPLTVEVGTADRYGEAK